MTPHLGEELCKFARRHVEANSMFLTRWVKGIITEIRCEMEPSKYFSIKPVRHVNKVKSLGRSHSNSYVINVAEAYNVSKGEEDNHAFTKAWFFAADVGGKGNPLKSVPFVGDWLANFVSLGFKAGRSYNLADSHSERQGYTQAENIATAQNLGIEQFVVEMDLETERCFIVRSKDFQAITLASQRSIYLPSEYDVENELRGNKNIHHPVANFDINLYLCDSEIKKENFTESWFFIQSTVNQAFATDGDGPTEKRLLKVIRGSQSYRELHIALRNISKSSLEMDTIGHQTPADVLIKNWGHLLGGALPDDEAAKFLYTNVEGSFPGTIEGIGAQNF